MGGDLRPGSAATLPDGTTLEVFLDEPGHLRMANPDEELIALPAASARHLVRQSPFIAWPAES